METLEW